MVERQWESYLKKEQEKAIFPIPGDRTCLPKWHQLFCLLLPHKKNLQAGFLSDPLIVAGVY